MTAASIQSNRRFSHWQNLCVLRVSAMVLFLVAAGSMHAQFPPGSVLSAAATRPGAVDGKAWVYAAWSPASLDLLKGHTLAVYFKPGLPASPSSFTRLELVAPASPSVTALTPLINKGAQLGDAVGDLGPALDALIAAPEVTSAPSLPAKLAAALALSATQPAASAAIHFLAPRFRCVSFALGRAWAGQLPVGVGTLEIRDFNPGAGNDRLVLARFTLNVGAPTPLPAPSAPRMIPPVSSMDDLRAPLVWGESEDLLHRTPLIQGFDVWRMKGSAARQLGLDLRSPTVSELQAAGLRVNLLPIGVPHPLSPADAAVLADPAAALYHDAGPDAPHWQDGEEYAWFIVATDLLGQPGIPSPAGFGVICSSMPPSVPGGLQVANLISASPVAGAKQQNLKVRWTPNSAGKEAVTRYEIYRGSTDLPPIASTNAPPDAWRVAQIVADASLQQYEWIDTSLDALTDPSLYSHGVWYAVRAVRVGACGPVASTLSPPVFATFRRLDAPDSPSGSVDVNCSGVIVLQGANSISPDLTGSKNSKVVHYSVAVTRRDRGVAWTEILVDGNNFSFSAPSPQIHFGEEEDVVNYDIEVPNPDGISPVLQIAVRAGSFWGTVSTYTVESVQQVPALGQRLTAGFTAATYSLEDFGTDPVMAGLPSAKIDSNVVSFNTNGIVVLALTGVWNADDTFMVTATPRTGAAALTRFLGVAHPVNGRFLSVNDPLILTDFTAASLQTYAAIRLLPTHDGPEGPCAHVAFSPGSSVIHPVRIQLNLTPRTRAWRVYRRVDEGSLTLIAQGTASYDPFAAMNSVTAVDDAMPPSGGHVCYFGQVADENGNWSPQAALGCEDLLPKTIPVPLLAAPEASGTANSPSMMLHWFCPPSGVSQFAIILKPVAGKQPIQGLQSPKGARRPIRIVSSKPAAWNSRISLLNAITSLTVSSELLTGPVGSLPADTAIGEGPNFTFSVDVEPGVTYDVQVVAVDSHGNHGHASFAQRFTWKPPQSIVDRNVPWPQRSLPPVKALNPGVSATLLSTNLVFWPQPTNAHAVGIRIGEIPLKRIDALSMLQRQLTPGELGGLFFTPAIPLDAGFEPYLYTDTVSDTPRPTFTGLGAVLYRRQETNANYPVVTGNTVQVSPLVKAIAANVTPGNGTELLDPSIAVVARLAGPNDPGVRITLDLYLIDHHPVISGARYQYWILHFGRNGEPDQTIPAGEVEIP